MICVQLPGAAIFFPDDEIQDAKPIMSAGAPSIAFRSRGTGGLQFIKRFGSEAERDSALAGIRNAADEKKDEEDLTEKLMERIRATEEELQKMRAAQKQEKPKKQKKQPAKKAARKTQKKPFEIPTDEEIICYIKEKGIDKKLDIQAEVIAESFRSIYEKEEDTGEKDENGFAVRKTVWRKANGSLVENWKSCLQTFKARQLVWDAKAEKKEARPGKKNQFCDFEQNQYTDEELEEIIGEKI